MARVSSQSDSSTLRGYLLIHASVLLFGFTPIMGRLITVDAVTLVWWRMSLAGAVLLLLPMTWRGFRTLSPRLALGCCLAGGVLAITWALFYLSVKLTDASVAAVCLATSPLFVALFGPVVARRPYRRIDLLLALAMIPGVALVVGGIPHAMYLGLGVGLLSAAVLVVFSSLNKLLASRIQPLSATCIEMLVGAAFLTVMIALLPRADAGFLLPRGRNLWLLLVFAIAFTAVPIAMLLASLRDISVFAQQVVVNLEPVYAVLLAIPILAEQRQLTALFYLGVLVVVGTVVAEPMLRWLRRRFTSGHPAQP
ncbi:MAG TPA: DMT family transporter [Nevskiaceae bacterium]